MEMLRKLVVFSLDDQKFALHLESVDRIIPIIEIHPLPMSPEYISGTINFYGEFLPVVNLRKVFLLPERDLELSDQLIIIKTSKNTVALWVDRVGEIVELADAEISKTENVFLEVAYIDSLFKLRDGLVLIHNPDKFLTVDQTTRLEIALKSKRDKENKPAKISKSPLVKVKAKSNPKE